MFRSHKMLRISQVPLPTFAPRPIKMQKNHRKLQRKALKHSISLQTFTVTFTYMSRTKTAIVFMPKALGEGICRVSEWSMGREDAVSRRQTGHYGYHVHEPERGLTSACMCPLQLQNDTQLKPVAKIKQLRSWQVCSQTLGQSET